MFRLVAVRLPSINFRALNLISYSTKLTTSHFDTLLTFRTSSLLLLYDERAADNFKVFFRTFDAGSVVCCLPKTFASLLFKSSIRTQIFLGD